MPFHHFESLPQGEIGGTHIASQGAWQQVCQSSIIVESVFAVQAQYFDDPSPDKVSLMYGVYMTEHGQPFVLPAVKMVQPSDNMATQARQKFLGEILRQG